MSFLRQPGRFGAFSHNSLLGCNIAETIWRLRRFSEQQIVVDFYCVLLLQSSENRIHLVRKYSKFPPFKYFVLMSISDLSFNVFVLRCFSYVSARIKPVPPCVGIRPVVVLHQVNSRRGSATISGSEEQETMGSWLEKARKRSWLWRWLNDIHEIEAQVSC